MIRGQGCWTWGFSRKFGQLQFTRWRRVLYFPDTEFHTFFSGQVPITSDIHAVRIFPDMSRARPSCRSWPDSLVYTSGRCRRWRLRMEVKIMAGSLFVHCKIAYFYSVTAEKWLVVSLPNFVTIRRTHLSISCKMFRWIRWTKLKIHAMEFCYFIKNFVSPSGLFVPCSLTATSTWQPRLTAHCPIGERH